MFKTNPNKWVFIWHLQKHIHQPLRVVHYSNKKYLFSLFMSSKCFESLHREPGLFIQSKCGQQISLA